MNDSGNNCGCDSPDGEAVAETEAPVLGPQAALARFRFAADAGYFADELQAQFSIRTTVQLEENFDATTGQSLVAFVLAVSPELADEAIPKLRQLIETAQTGEYDGLPGGLDGPAAPVSAVSATDGETFEAQPVAVRPSARVPSWLFLLIVCAGAVALLATQRQQAPAEGPAEDAAAELTDEQVFLRELIAASPEPWVRESPDGRRQEVSLDKSTGSIRLREDGDGDGVYEIDRRIPLK